MCKSSIESRTCSKTNCNLFHVQGTKFLDSKLDRSDQPPHQQHRSGEPAYNQYNAKPSHNKSVSQPSNAAYQQRICDSQAPINSRCYKSGFFTAPTSDENHARPIAATTSLLSPNTNTTTGIPPATTSQTSTSFPYPQKCGMGTSPTLRQQNTLLSIVSANIRGLCPTQGKFKINLQSGKDEVENTAIIALTESPLNSGYLEGEVHM